MKTLKISLLHISQTRQILSRFGRTSISFLQKKLHVSFDYAKRLHDEYGDTGIREIIDNFKKHKFNTFHCLICSSKFISCLSNSLTCPCCGILEDDQEVIFEFEENIFEKIILKNVFDLSFIKRAQEIMKESVIESIILQKEKSKIYRNSIKGKFWSSFSCAIRRCIYQSSLAALSKQERFEIGKFYKECPIGYEVDHIIPISQGGKHFISNLQYLTIHENRSKGNRYNRKP